MFNILAIVMAAVLGAGTPAAGGTAEDRPVPAEPADSVVLSAHQVADLIIDEAYKYLGTPYRYGARGPKAFDCSGFTSYVYRKFGYTLSHSSKGQAHDGRAVEGTYADLQKGDILIFGARGNRKSVGHVGIFIEMSADGTDFTFVHAARGGVMVSHILEEYYANRFLAARRILPDFDIELPEPEDNTLDFEATYGNVFLPIKDTLALDSGDSRIVLFGDGTWAAVAEDGSLGGPGAALPGRIVLNPGGTWQEVPERTSSVLIPSSAVPAAATVQAAQQPAAAATAAATSADETPGEAEYHVIRSGDTLDKISKTYHTTIDRLCELNGITRKTILHIGRRLRVK